MKTSPPAPNPSRRKKSGERGMALLLAVLFVTIALILLGALSTRLVNQANQTTRFVAHEECFYGVEAGFTQALYQLENGDGFLVGVDEWRPTTTHFPALEFDSPGVNPLTMESLPNVQYFAVTQDWITDGLDNNGDGVVDDNGERFYYTIYAAAKRDDYTRRIEAVLVGRDVNVWRNAIFAGAGQAGGLINGNVSIHGSVHLLGSNLGMGAAALEAIDLSGTSLIHNNYDGLPNNLRSRIPALEKVNEAGVMVETLNANLRVKNGLVGLSGNSEIGQANVAGDYKKDFMDGTFVNDGWTGTAVIDDGGRGDPKSVFSDNGWDVTYDLGDKVPFPRLSDDWRWANDGRREWDAVAQDWYSHEDYFSQVLLADANNPNDGVFNGNMTLATNGNNFYWNASRNIQSTTLPATLPPDTEDYIIFNSATDVLRVNGQIRVNGNLSFTGQGNQRTINYSGRGAVLVNGDVNVDTNLLTCNNGDPANIADSFPVKNILGLMSTNNMMVGSSAQLTIMGAFYAQNQIKSQRQTNIAGTFVSNFFDMGTNVPSIFQVPTLADNLPLGMIGNYPIMSMSRVSWREL